jgi:heme-degrading monooxygenase HmoA
LPILRIARTRAKPGREAELERVLSENLAGRLGGVDGLMAAYKGRPTDYGSTEYVVITIWRDKDALRAYAGASTPAPMIRDGEAEGG